MTFVDDEIFGLLEAEGIRPAPTASDEEFLRRVSLDLAGEIPDPDVVRAFLADASTDKRDRAVESLLHSEAFVDRWTMWLGDLVQNVPIADNIRLWEPARNAYYAYIHDAIQAGTPYHIVVRDLLTGQGDNFYRGTPNYAVRQIRQNGPPQDTFDSLAAHSAERFLGLQLGCLSCHNGAGHLDGSDLYLATKTREQFWEMAAFFSRVRIAGARDGAMFKFRVFDDTKGGYRLDTTSGNKTPRQQPIGKPDVVLPRFLLSHEEPAPYESYRGAYARLLTSHPQFARATVNRIWKELFSLGLVEPVDALDLARLDPDNPPPAPWRMQSIHARLLDRLALDFEMNGYDLRGLLRLLVRSAAYQLSSRYPGATWSDAFTPFFARHYPRRLWAEEALDAIFKATGVPPEASEFRVIGMDSAVITRAMRLPDPLQPDTYGRSPYRLFLDTFGRGNRGSAVRSSDGSLLQALDLLNDRIVTERVKRSTRGSAVQALLDASTDPGAIVEKLYLRTLSRLPSAEERAEAIRYVTAGDLTRRVEDLQFALLNHVEFLFSY
ncbi:MAG TPA: DUF1549 domain-containing protein [Thermoanaerobaculia bacterium]|nr:DUF1549 domain-containing protein [Thermoanaerobaculia bacterium]